MTSSTPRPAGSPAGGEPPPGPPDSTDLPLPQPDPGPLGIGPLGLDRLGVTQAIGGMALGLIALFSSYDHISFAGRNLPIQQQWGIPFIAASVAVVVVDAQLASGSRLRAEHRAARAADEAARAADETARERNLASEERARADRERNLAAEARDRQAEAAERQRTSLERLHQAAVLSARVQLDPSDTNRARLQTFLSLLSQTAPEDLDL